MFINYFKCFIWSLVIFLGLSIVATIFNYFNVISGTILRVIFLVIPIISIFVGSYKLGKISDKKGYIEGIKFGGIWVLLFTFICLFCKSLYWGSATLYVILIICSILGSILGINRKSNP